MHEQTRSMRVAGQSRLALRFAVVVIASATLALGTAAAIESLLAFAQSCGNPIACENLLAGTPSSTWDISGGIGDQSIQGFATDISVNRGGTIQFKIKTPASAYSIDVYRMGYYGGTGARWVANVSPSVTLPQVQPACLNDAATGLIDCGNWSVSASWNVPSTAVSGVYFARLTRTDTGGASHIFFVVRDDSSTAAVLFQTSDTTWQAYNDYGGNSLYVGSPASRAYKVSYNRPMNTALSSPNTWVMTNEYPAIRWLEANGYDVSYTTGLDSDRRGALIKNHRVFLSVGHDEYWSSGQRSNVEAARAASVNLAFLSGNEVFWKTRWEPSSDTSHTVNRTLVAYKETLASAQIDPADPPTWTGTWRDPRFSPPADGGRPENSLTGTLFMVNGPQFNALVVPSVYAPMRFWRNTSIASLGPGQSTTLTNGGCNCMLGYEWDEDVDNGSRPAGLIRLSSTTANVGALLQDYGGTYASGTATHSLLMYRHASGALVFGAGTVNWAHGLDDGGAPNGYTAELAIQQATVNLLADMGVQPATPRPGLVLAIASSDTTPPTSVITSPAPGPALQVGKPVTIAGTASDQGGVVAGVEVSVDGGSTWHPANGLTNWTYAWTPLTPAYYTLRSRAVDDSGNLESPSAGVTVTVGMPCDATCASLFPSTATPAVAIQPDSNSIEVGVKFRSDVAGYVTGLRFYKGGPGNDVPHDGSLWTSGGTLLGRVTFSNETNSGWQQAYFSTPVSISANTLYVASYHALYGQYSVTQNFFTNAGADNGPLHAPLSSSVGGNGLELYSASDSFPTGSYADTNYWVDVVFKPASGGPTPTPSPTPTASPSPTATPTATLTATATRTPTATATPTATVTSGAATPTPTPTPTNVAGATPSPTPTPTPSRTPTSVPMATATSTATPTPGASVSVFPSTAVPAVANQADTNSVELGLKFSSEVAGRVTGVRFYKGGVGNDGPHVGSLWTNGGTLLAQVTFASETSSGWQQAMFATPVAINANTVYVISYHAPVGAYSVDLNYFTNAGADNAPLHAPVSSPPNGNGVYTYSSTSTYPTQTYGDSNYWVDVVFAR